MKYLIVLIPALAIASCGPSEQEIKLKAEQEQKAKDSIAKFEEDLAFKKRLDSIELYKTELTTFYDNKISLIKHGYFTEKELEKYTTFEQMDSLMKSVTDKIYDEVKKNK